MRNDEVSSVSMAAIVRMENLAPGMPNNILNRMAAQVLLKFGGQNPKENVPVDNCFKSIFFLDYNLSQTTFVCIFDINKFPFAMNELRTRILRLKGKFL
jgi:hypothetical protein